METKTMVTTNFSHPAIEACKASLDLELTDFAKLQAKEDAQKNSELTEALFNIKVRDFVHPKIQGGIGFIKNTLLVTSMAFDAAEIDKAAQKKAQGINNEVNDRLHGAMSLKRKLESIVIDPFKKKYGKWLPIIAICVGKGDAVLAYGGFRHGGCTIFQALIISLAIGAIISASHLFYAKWIKQANNQNQRIIRILLILLVAFIFFAWIGNLRADATNNTVNIALEGDSVSSVSTSPVNGWAISIISFVLFAAVLFLSLLLWKSKQERLNEEEHSKLSAEIGKMDTEIKALKKEMNAIENQAAAQKSEARKVFDYAINSIKECKNIGQKTITKYKQTYARFHNDDVPMFFSNPCDFVYDESFKFSKAQNPENL